MVRGSWDGLHPDENRLKLRSMENPPLAYHVTTRAHGTWLPGDERGSVDRGHNGFGTETLRPDDARERHNRERMPAPPTALSPADRRVIVEETRRTCAFRGWRLQAVHARGEHVHTLVTAPVPPEAVVGELKAWCSRRLHEAGRHLDQEIWARHASTRYCFSEASLRHAWSYVLDAQGPRMAHWPNRGDAPTWIAEHPWWTRRNALEER